MNVGPVAYWRYQGGEVNSGGISGEIPVPQRHVEGGVLATHETGGANAVSAPEGERQQQQRPTVGVVSDNDERQKTLTFANVPLPGAKEIEALIRRGGTVVFENGPEELRMVVMTGKI